ncbi:type II toxin-antitoxin system RelE/ParE family toxin [Siccirubricoccus phaeus]|uniref:type II toxin-antitoxin system RelE/ParE family toxin n=1 Tax=Siccirubricoccus phaeus TaxID=2595053 RepID=UPI0011F0ABDC|nr:type II toxin-antitoxin system RelE/ParE family toxin [Siccirubricoccus phaeus]
MRIVWTEPAIRDLQAARAYIARDKPGAAAEQMELVLGAVAGLIEFPHLGRPGRRPGTRELVVSRTPFVVPYRLRGDAIEILRVLHGRQRWPDDFQG